MNQWRVDAGERRPKPRVLCAAEGLEGVLFKNSNLGVLLPQMGEA